MENQIRGARSSGFGYRNVPILNPKRTSSARGMSAELIFWACMYVVRSAILQDLVVTVSWIRTLSECEDWAGSQVTFPIDPVDLPRTIGFTEQNAYEMSENQSMIAFGQIIDKPHGRQHLAKVIVSPVHRGRGYGRRFLAELLHRTTAERVSLNVLEDNSVAIALYAAAGFADAERPLDQQPSPRSRYMEWQRGHTD